MTTTRVLTGPRLSDAARCARRCVYRGLGIQGIPHSEETLRRFARGQQIGRMRAAEVAETLAAQGREAICEKEVPWEFGVGHADVWIPDEDTVVEIVSSADESLPPVKALQVTLYAINLPAEKASVLVVNPTTYRDKAYPVSVEGLRPIAEQIMDAVVRGIRDGELPPRLNGDVSAGPGHWECSDCVFRKHCYQDWKPTPAGRLPEAEADFLRLADIAAEEGRTKKLAAELKAEREEIRARLAARMEPGSRYVAGGLEVWRTRVAGRRTLRFADLEAAGFELPAEVEPFVNEGAESERWFIREREA